MSGPSKRFPNKKAVKFELVPRSQRDPLIVDNDAPPIVLVPKRKSDAERLPDGLEELLPSKSQSKQGIINKALAKDGIVLDQDVLQAMSHEFDFDNPNNVLDDDFFQQAGGLIENDSDDDEQTEEFVKFIEFNSKNNADNADMDAFMDGGDDDERTSFRSHQSRVSSFRKPASTNYSMTSSVMRRSQGLQQIDEHFERLYEREYADETEIGALDLNDIKGEDLLDDMEKIKQLKQEVRVVRKRYSEEYVPEVVSEHHKNAIIGSDSDEDDADLVKVESARYEDKVDCESILSYNSTLYNHPKLIVEQRKRKASSTASQAERMDFEMVDACSEEGESKASSSLAELSHRPNNETPEERLARKKALKNYRRLRREERRTNQEVFKREKLNLSQKKSQPTIKL